jgi:magnesium transporter
MARPSATFTGRLFDASDADREIEVGPDMPKPTEKQLLWVDVSRRPEDLKHLDEILGWSNVLSDLPEPDHRPKIVEGKETTRLRVTGIEKDAPKPEPVAIDLVAGENVVVSVHDKPIAGLDQLLEVVQGNTAFGALDAAAFVAMLLDGLLAGFFNAVEGVEQEIDELDEKALRASDPDTVLAELVALRGQIATLRRTLNPQRAVFYSLERPEFSLDGAEDTSWQILADRFREAMEAVENSRELLVGCFDILMAGTGQRTNDVMRVLTVVSSILLPAVVVAGIMGMNFKPSFFDDPTNFYLVIAVIIATGVAALLFARHRHWI